MRAGIFFRCSRIPSVMAPRPIEVKKLIEKRVLRGLSIGKMLPRNGSSALSWNRSTTFLRPIPSTISWNMILMKIRDDDVVSSSFILTVSSTVHEMPSVIMR